MTRTYKNTQMTRTNTTFGDAPVRYVYCLSGAVNKPEGMRPFLTSLRDCRDYINSELPQPVEKPDTRTQSEKIADMLENERSLTP